MVGHNVKRRSWFTPVYSVIEFYYSFSTQLGPEYSTFGIVIVDLTIAIHMVIRNVYQLNITEHFYHSCDSRSVAIFKLSGTNTVRF